MNGMTGWKGVVFLAGERHTPQMSHNGSPIGPLLVKQGLQETRQRRGGKGSEKDVVGYAPFMAASVPGIDPPSGSKRADDMLIGAPCGSFSRPLRQGPRMMRDRIGDRYVCPRRAHSDRHHRVHCIHRRRIPTDSELATAVSVPFDAICLPREKFPGTHGRWEWRWRLFFPRPKAQCQRKRIPQCKQDEEAGAAANRRPALVLINLLHHDVGFKRNAAGQKQRRRDDKG
jgi:hypothetical protein